MTQLVQVGSTLERPVALQAGFRSNFVVGVAAGGDCTHTVGKNLCH